MFLILNHSLRFYDYEEMFFIPLSHYPFFVSLPCFMHFILACHISYYHLFLTPPPPPKFVPVEGFVGDLLTCLTSKYAFDKGMAPEH
jgi:hypothetical protein